MGVSRIANKGHNYYRYISLNNHDNELEPYFLMINE